LWVKAHFHQKLRLYWQAGSFLVACRQLPEPFKDRDITRPGAEKLVIIYGNQEIAGKSEI
jgi:hypothetical protein